ncbi:L-rhamnose/proton symporter RhaT [Oleiharenicola lentus]|uniref:L-rhamnose/proton symporter RhaT n=1 Tax=Oleiharenicola lentus TaxID=2508720 RepID=UPI003F677135
MPPESNPILGTLLHTVGAASAALCYAPQRYVKNWKWQTYWLVQAAACWLILPWIFAYFTIPQLGTVLAEAPGSAMRNSYLLGVLYGVGGIAFGAAIRYIGFSLTYALAIGLSCVLGTLIPTIQAGTLGQILSNTGGTFVVGGVLLGGLATFITGLAGFRKEREITTDSVTKTQFNPRVGLPIVVLAGVLSAVFSFSLAAGQPIADVAAKYGAGNFQGNVIYLFSHSGAFTTTLIYCLYLITRDKSAGEFTSAGGANLGANYALSILTGLLWYLQFFFYGLGHVRMGDLKFSSWAIHMIILILLSCGFGVAIGEWKSCRPATKLIITGAIVLLFAAVGLLTYGNYLAAPPATAAVVGH